MGAGKRLPKSEPQNCLLFPNLSRFERVFVHKQRHMQPLTRRLFLPKLFHICLKLAGTCACTVEAPSCGPWNQRLFNYQNKSCKSYAFSFNCLKGKGANLNHSNIDIGGQGAKTSKSEFRREDISLRDAVLVWMESLQDRDIELENPSPPETLSSPVSDRLAVVAEELLDALNNSVSLKWPDASSAPILIAFHIWGGPPLPPHCGTPQQFRNIYAHTPPLSLQAYQSALLVGCDLSRLFQRPWNYKYLWCWAQQWPQPKPR